jgi:flagellar motor component MotA
LSVGLLFAIVGVIGILTNMSDPDAIGPAFSIACIC